MGNSEGELMKGKIAGLNEWPGIAVCTRILNLVEGCCAVHCNVVIVFLLHSKHLVTCIYLKNISSF
jgi:ABC-type iron transport system FetAB permease component